MQGLQGVRKGLDQAKNWAAEKARAGSDEPSGSQSGMSFSALLHHMMTDSADLMLLLRPQVNKKSMAQSTAICGYSVCC